MIHAKINENGFLDTVRHSPVIAFQKLRFGYAVAAPLVAFYAPINHPGGGNLPSTFIETLGYVCLTRLSDPHARTLRPTAKPIPTEALRAYLSTFGSSPEPMSNYDKAPGDHAAVIESECQVVIQAIEEHNRPDLKDAMGPVVRDALSDALDLVIEHAESARELAEVGEDKPRQTRLHLLQASTAMKTALEFLLKP
jgi:hypothetical protein